MDRSRPYQPTAPAVKGRWSVLFPLVAAFLAAIVTFVASHLYAGRQTAEIRADAVSIADDAAPSIEQLSAARGDLLRFQALMADYVNDAVLGRPVDRSGVDRARMDVEQDLHNYLGLPIYPGEREAWRVVSANLAELDEVAMRVMRLVAIGRADRANDLADVALRQATARTSAAIAATIDVNARQAHDMAIAIEQGHDRAARIAMGLDVLSVSLALVAGSLAIAYVLRYLRLSQQYARFVERRADELEQFAARVAHDVLGPLTAVGVSLDVVERRLDGDATAQAAIARGQSGIARTRAIVDGLLSFARAGAAPEPDARADVTDVVGDVVGEVLPLARDAGVDLVVDPFRPCTVRCSPGVLTSIVSNLVRNAIKYIGVGAVRRIELHVGEAGHCVRIEVADSGPGVAPALQAAIFEPYVRVRGTNQPGLGLGLATVKRLAESHGGRVGLRSSAGNGSTFWVELPMVDRSAATHHGNGPFAACGTPLGTPS